MRDHIPVSADGVIKVRLREASPSPAEQTDLGELTWKPRPWRLASRQLSGTASRSTTPARSPLPAWKHSLVNRRRPGRSPASGRRRRRCDRPRP